MLHPSDEVESLLTRRALLTPDGEPTRSDSPLNEHCCQSNLACATSARQPATQKESYNIFGPKSCLLFVTVLCILVNDCVLPSQFRPAQQVRKRFGIPCSRPEPERKFPSTASFDPQWSVSHFVIDEGLEGWGRISSDGAPVLIEVDVKHTSLDEERRYERASYIKPVYAQDCGKEKENHHKWQGEMHPMCNNMHEFDMLSTGINSNGKGIDFVGKGHRRAAWSMLDPEGNALALKTLLFRNSCDDDRQYLTKREFQSLDRMSGSRHASKVYGHCGCTGLHEFLGDGLSGHALLDSFKNDHGKDKRLHLAYEVAAAISDVHRTEQDGIPAIVYGHLQPKNVLFVNGTCKLSDFEQGEFLKWNERENRVCGFYRPTGSVSE